MQTQQHALSKARPAQGTFKSILTTRTSICNLATKMSLLKFVLLLLYAVASVSTLPIISPPLDSTPEHLVWDAFLTIDTRYSDEDKTRKIPKSIFITPNLNESKITCMPGYKLGPDGKCYKTLNIDPLDILKTQIASLFTPNRNRTTTPVVDYDEEYDYSDYGDSTESINKYAVPLSLGFADDRPPPYPSRVVGDAPKIVLGDVVVEREPYRQQPFLADPLDTIASASGHAISTVAPPTSTSQSSTTSVESSTATTEQTTARQSTTEPPSPSTGRPSTVFVPTVYGPSPSRHSYGVVENSSQLPTVASSLSEEYSTTSTATASTAETTVSSRAMEAITSPSNAHDDTTLVPEIGHPNRGDQVSKTESMQSPQSMTTERMEIFERNSNDDGSVSSTIKPSSKPIETAIYAQTSPIIDDDMGTSPPIDVEVKLLNTEQIYPVEKSGHGSTLPTVAEGPSAQLSMEATYPTRHPERISTAETVPPPIPMALLLMKNETVAADLDEQTEPIPTETLTPTLPASEGLTSMATTANEEVGNDQLPKDGSKTSPFNSDSTDTPPTSGSEKESEIYDYITPDVLPDVSIVSSSSPSTTTSTTQIPVTDFPETSSSASPTEMTTASESRTEAVITMSEQNHENESTEHDAETVTMEEADRTTTSMGEEPIEMIRRMDAYREDDDGIGIGADDEAANLNAQLAEESFFQGNVMAMANAEPDNSTISANESGDAVEEALNGASFPIEMTTEASTPEFDDEIPEDDPDGVGPESTSESSAYTTLIESLATSTTTNSGTTVPRLYRTSGPGQTEPPDAASTTPASTRSRFSSARDTADKSDVNIKLGINCYLKNYLKHFYIMCT